MRKGFNLLLLLLLCFALSGCFADYKTKDGDSEPIPISDEIIEKLSATKTVVVTNLWNENELTKTITDINEIEKIIDLISRSTENIGDVTYEGARYYLEMYNIDNQLIDVVEVYNQRIRFQNYTKHGYKLNMEDLMKIIEN